MVDTTSDGSSKPLITSQMEHDSSHLLSCASAPPMPEHDQLNNVESSSNRLGGSLEETAMGPRNLRTKRITTI